MHRLQPTFLTLPREIRGNILQRVDYPTRFAARRCCHRMLNDIETLDIQFNEVALSIDFNSVELCLYQTITSVIKIEYHYSDHGCKMIITHCGDQELRREKLIPDMNFIEVVTRDFHKIVMRPTEKIGKLRINTHKYKQSGNKKFEQDQAMILERTRKIMESSHFKLKVRTFDMYYFGLQDELLCFLPFLEPRTLKAIFLFGYMWTGNFPRFQLDRAVETEQWRMAKQCGVFEFTVPLPMEQWWHFASVTLRVRSFKLADFKKLLKHFTTSEVFKYCQVKCYLNHHEGIEIKKYLTNSVQETRSLKFTHCGVTVTLGGAMIEFSK